MYRQSEGYELISGRCESECPPCCQEMTPAAGGHAQAAPGAGLSCPPGAGSWLVAAWRAAARH